MRKSHALLAGVGRCDLTPLPGNKMACFPSGPGRTGREAKGALNPIMARVLVLDDGEESVALCSCDLVLIQWDDVREIRSRASEITGIQPTHIIPFCTHTHHGPESTYHFGGSPDDPWIEQMKSGMVEAIVAAYEQREQVLVGAGLGEVRENYNRRLIKPDGKARNMSENPERVPMEPTDPTLGVLRVDRPDGRPLAVLLNWTAHALVMPTNNLLFTADYPGEVTRAIESKLGGGTAALFANGCAGNIHPYDAFMGREKMARLGKLLADESLRVWDAVVPEKLLPLVIEQEGLCFPNRRDPELTVEVEISAFTIGADIAMVFLQGEPFVEIQLMIRQHSPFQHTFVVGYSSGWVGYMPLKKDYQHGGYGVELYEQDPPALSRTSLPEGAGEEIYTKAVNLLNKLDFHAA